MTENNFQLVWTKLAECDLLLDSEVGKYAQAGRGVPQDLAWARHSIEQAQLAMLDLGWPDPPNVTEIRPARD